MARDLIATDKYHNLLMTEPPESLEIFQIKPPHQQTKYFMIL